MAETLFPLADTDERAVAVSEGDDAELRPGVTAILDSLALPGLDLSTVEVSRFPEGSLPVYAVGEDLVLKLYPPVHRAESVVETGMLAGLDGALPTPPPKVVATGELDGWGYLLMTRLRGQELKAVWPELTPATATTWPTNSARRWPRCTPPSSTCSRPWTGPPSSPNDAPGS